DGKSFSRGDFRLIMLLTIAAYVILYLMTWTRGHAILLGLAVLLAASWPVFEAADQSTPFGVDRVAQSETSGVTNPSGLANSSNDKQTETAAIEIVIAVTLLGGGVLLDRRGRAGAATPLLLVGSLYAIFAASTLGTDVDNVYATGCFVIVAGVMIGIAGSFRRRRPTPWI